MAAQVQRAGENHWLAGVDRRPRLSIGAAVALISKEFPALTDSKLRYLEDVEIVTPSRTKSGYRKYSDADIERVKYCLRAQRDTFKPLDLIREDLRRMDAGIDIGQRQTVQVVAKDGELLAANKESLTLVELVDASGADEQLVETLTETGLLQLDYRGRFNPQAIAVVTLVRQLAAYGIEPRHLRMVAVNAARVADLIDQAVTGTSKRNREHDKERVRVLAQLFASLAQAEIRLASDRIGS